MLLHTNSEKTDKVQSENSKYSNEVQNVQAQDAAYRKRYAQNIR